MKKPSPAGVVKPVVYRVEIQADEALRESVDVIRDFAN